MRDTFKEFYGDNAKNSDDYSKIISEFHIDRLESMIK